MTSTFNEAPEQASNPKMPPPKSPLRTPASSSRTSILFQDKVRETVVNVPALSSSSPPKSSANPRPSTPRPTPVDNDIYASGALPAFSVLPAEDSSNGRIQFTGLPDSIRIPPFKSSSRPSYVSNYPEDEIDWSEPPPPLPLDPGPCRNFRDPQAAAEEERERHFAQQRQRRFEKLVSASDALRDAPALPTEEDDLDAAERPTGPQEFDSANHQLESDSGFAGEIGGVHIPGAWRSRSKVERSTGEDDQFSDVAEGGGDTDDDGDNEEGWDAKFARAEVSDAGEDGRGWGVGGEHSGPEAWTYERRKKRSQGLAKGLATRSAAENPAAAPSVKHQPIMATHERAHPTTSAPSPTESQLVASGFEFHNELTEEEQIARFADKAFRRALREVLPSLSRKQQWYAWRRVNEENRAVKEIPEEALKDETKEKSEECKCKCPGNGQECDGDDGKCGKLLNKCRCDGCGDCDEHFRWHHPGGLCETEGESGELLAGGRMPKCICGEGRNAGEGQPVWYERDREICEPTCYLKKGENGEPDKWTSVCGCGGKESRCQCSPETCWCDDCPRSQALHHRPVLNPEVADRLSDWTNPVSPGRLRDGKPTRNISEELDLRHDVPASASPRIPGLGLLDPPSDPQLKDDTIRCSVEPEMPHRQLHRESTPAFEDRSPSPSPVSHMGSLEDMEMTDAPSNASSAPHTSRLPLPQSTPSPDPLSSPIHAVTAPQTPARPRSESPSRSRSPAKSVVTLPDPSTLKSTKGGGRRKSAVQGSKVEKTSTTKSRAVSRKVIAAKNAAEKAGGRVKEAVARIEASVKGRQQITPRRSARIQGRSDKGDS